MRSSLLPLVAIAALLLPLACFSRTPTPRDRDDVCEVVFKRFSKSGMFAANILFLSMPEGADPSDDFTARFKTFGPVVHKGSLATHSPAPGRQVIHRTTKQPGVLLQIRAFEWLGADRARVRVSYDMHSRGTGSCTYVLTRKGGTWEVAEERRGPQA